jgi:hypothetical protein
MVMRGSGRLPRYTVQILLRDEVELDPAGFAQLLRRWRDDVELLRGDADQLVLAVPTTDVPMLANIYDAAVDTYAPSLRDALRWSPAWRERHDAVLRCRHSLIVAMTAHRPVHHASMLLAFLGVLDTALAALDDDARETAVLHWLPSQQVMSHDRYRMLRAELGPTGPAINVRVASAGRPGQLLADTLGLAVLGLPDVQAVFSDRDPAEVAYQLLTCARRVFVGDRLDVGVVAGTALYPPLRDTLTLRL